MTEVAQSTGDFNDDDYGIYDTVEIEDMDFDDAKQAYFYPCPCGDKFSISLASLRNGEDIATCPSCSLKIKVIYDANEFVEFDEDES